LTLNVGYSYSEQNINKERTPVNKKQFCFLVMLSFIVSTAFGQSTIITPTKKVNQRMAFSDDMNWSNMELALTRQIENLAARASLNRKVKYGSDVYTLADLKASAELFLDFVLKYKACLAEPRLEAVCSAEMSNAINERFNIYRPVTKASEPGHGTATPSMFTAYYSPDLSGSLVPDAEHRYPLYALPESPADRGLSREKIDFDQALAGKGLELVWIKEPLYDIYLLHVQGGGRIRVMTPEGEKKFYVSYAGENGLSFKFVYHYMVANGMLTGADRGVDAQRTYIEANPEKAREIFASNPSYIFFKFTETEPLGIDNIPLTEGRSMAIDMTVYNHSGAISFVQASRPLKDAEGRTVLQPFSRFFMAQDTGGAIKGNARVDMYFGYGEEAEFTAYNTKVQGKHFFLIRKK
jgi:membrane-bound lytic murein transglycosylase A